MKNIVIIFSIVFLSVACTKDFEKTNTSQSKLYGEANIDAVFLGTQFQTLKTIANINNNRMLNLSRYVTLSGIGGILQDDTDEVFRLFYVNILRDLEQLLDNNIHKSGFENRLAMLKTWKAYIYYQLVRLYGPIPMSDAILKDVVKSNYKYDNELQVYTQILDLLKDAVATFNPGKNLDVLQKDALFPGSDGKSDIVRWRKYANTLMLDVAMNAQNMSYTLSRDYATLAINHEEWLLQSIADMPTLSFGKSILSDNSYYYTRWELPILTSSTKSIDGGSPSLSDYFFTYLSSYNDPRISSFFELTMARQAQSQQVIYYAQQDTITRVATTGGSGLERIVVNYTPPYIPMYESAPIPSGWTIGINPGTTITYRNPLNRGSIYQTSYVNRSFLAADAKTVLLNVADAYFLLAEANIKFGLGTLSAQTYYENGIKASFNQYGYSSSDANSYMNQDGIKWNTNGVGRTDSRQLYRADINGKGGDDNHLEQIYKQRYIADFWSGIDAWSLERRTRSLRFPPLFSSGSMVTVPDGSNGFYIYQERYIYPRNEMDRNNMEYLNGSNLLQKSSPTPNSARNGDNIVTPLGFAKPNPDLAAASKYNNWQIQYFENMFAYPYGRTYEAMLVNARKVFQMPTATDDQIKAAIGFKIVKVL